MGDNKDLTEKIILAFLLHEPSRLLNEACPIKGKDFSKKVFKQIYSAMLNLYAKGNMELQPEEVLAQIGRSASLEKEFRDAQGEALLYEINNMNTAAYDFNTQYDNLIKYSLFRELQESGIETLDLYNPTLSPDKALEMANKVDEMSYKDIIDHYREKIAHIADHYENFIEKSGIEAGDGLDELLRSFEEQPEIGMPLNGNILNTICRGARKKKVYLNSASSGSGKSRMAAGNVAKLGFPMYYDEKQGKWIETGMDCPVLFITTELEHQEVQTMFLAYISGVNEEKILNNRYDSADEKDRIKKALEIIQNAHNVYIEFIPEPSIDSVAAKIRLYVLQKGIEYVFYDYVHVSGATYKNKKDMRDDVWLMLFVDKLKQLANEYNLHIETATQLNASSYEDREVKNEAMIRGSKAAADKVDVAFITSTIVKEQEKSIARMLATQQGTREPNQIIDVYKNRRGKWRNVRIWRYADLGTCRSEDCFITDTGNNPIDFKSTKAETIRLVHEGAFPITDADTGEIVAENRKVVEVSDF